MTSYRNQSAYSLIELMVMVAILGILMIAMISMFLMLLRTGGKASALAKIKEEGDYTIQTMERQIRNASTIDPSYNCVSATQHNLITYTPQISGIGADLKREYKNSIGVIQVVEGDTTTKSLTSPAVTVTRLDFHCTNSSFYSGPVVRIEFDIQDSLSNPLVTETFSTTVIMRSVGGS